jgi:hypothetical protein
VNIEMDVGPQTCIMDMGIPALSFQAGETLSPPVQPTLPDFNSEKLDWVTSSSSSSTTTV